MSDVPRAELFVDKRFMVKGEKRIRIGNMRKELNFANHTFRKITFGSRYSRKDQVKFVEDNL